MYFYIFLIIFSYTTLTNLFLALKAWKEIGLWIILIGTVRYPNCTEGKKKPKKYSLTPKKGK